MKKLVSYPALPIGIFFAAILLAIFLPTFFGLTFIQSDYDLFLYYYPVFDFYSNALHTGQSFLWLPGIFSGFPVYLSQAGGFFEPFNLLIFRIFSVVPGMHLRLALDILFVFVASYAAARALGLSRAAAALVGPSYLLSFDWRYLSNPIIANSLFLLPFLMFCIVRAYADGRINWRYIALGGAGLGLSVLGGYTQLIFYAVVLAGLFAFGHLLFIEGQRTFWYLWRAVGAFLMMVLIGASLGLPQILPASTFLPFTSRGTSAAYDSATLKVIEPTDLVLAVVPPYFYVPYVTAGRKPLFVGAIWFFLAFGALTLSIVALVRTSRWTAFPLQQKRMIIVAAVFLFAFVAALKWSPLYLVLNTLPVFDLFRFPFRFMFLGTFLLSLLGAFGFDFADRLSPQRLFRYGVYVVASISTFCVSALAVLQVLGSSGSEHLSNFLFRGITLLQGHLGLYKDLTHYKEAVVRGLDAYRELLSFKDLAITVPLILLLLTLMLTIMLIREVITVERFRRWALVLCVATIFSITLVEWRSYDSTELLQRASVLTTLVSAEEQKLYRAYSFVPEEASLQAIPPQYKLSYDEQHELGKLFIASASPNLNLWGGLSSVDGYDQFEPIATLSAMGQVGGELGAGYGGRSVEERRLALLSNLPVLGMMGGKYIISGVPLGSKNLSLLATSSVTSYNMTLFTYINRVALPMYYIARNIAAVPHASFTDLASHANLEWGNITYLDCNSCIQTSGKGLLTLTAEHNGEYTFTVITTTSQYIVLSQTNVPGWHAFLDGREIAIQRANGLYMAVLVPPGTHTVHFLYVGVLNELPLLRMFGIVRT